MSEMRKMNGKFEMKPREGNVECLRRCNSYLRKK